MGADEASNAKTQVSQMRRRQVGVKQTSLDWARGGGEAGKKIKAVSTVYNVVE